MQHPPSGWFPDEVLAAVVAHMNEDHRDDSLSIVRTLGGLPDATGATVRALDPAGVVFGVDLGSGPGPDVMVPWQSTPRERADIRHELVRMTEESRSVR